jgi:hypothetical protein
VQQGRGFASGESDRGASGGDFHDDDLGREL